MEKNSSTQETLEFNAAISVLDQASVKSLIDEYLHMANPKRLGFNIFSLVSPIYHRENLHSDIIAAFLNPHEAHGEKDSFLKKFLEWLNVLLDNENRRTLYYADYRNVSVERESGHVDIMICDKSSGKAILIENKIAGAVDQNRQLPKYLDYAESANYTVEVILYLNLSELKNPNKIGWQTKNDKKKSDHDRIEPLLLRACAFSHSSNCMLNGWIRPCEHQTNRLEILTLLRQYGDLLENLGANAMNESLIEKFYEKIMAEKQLLSNTMVLTQMVEQLPMYRARRLTIKFPYTSGGRQPFDSIFIYKEVDAVFTQTGNKGLSIDVLCNQDNYEIFFWDRLWEKNGTNRVKKALENIRLNHRFEPDYANNRYKAFYDFPSEEGMLYEHLKTIFEDLCNSRQDWEDFEP